MGKSKHNKQSADKAPAVTTETAAQPEAEQTQKKKKGTWVLHPKTGKGLALHIVLDLLIPYGYLMLCGAVFDKWLRLYNMTTFVFFSYVTLQLAGIVFAIICIVNFSKRKKPKKRK